MRLTVGQNFRSFTNGRGYAAGSRGYGWAQVSAETSLPRCGGVLEHVVGGVGPPFGDVPDLPANGDQGVAEPVQFRLRLSLSVGSIIMVPGTGQDTVGAWNP